MTASSYGVSPEAAREAALDARLVSLARQGWRVDTTSATRATVSRPWLWLPTWLHLVLVLGTCGAWAIVWAYSRSPGIRRTTMFVTGEGGGQTYRVPNT